MSKFLYKIFISPTTFGQFSFDPINKLQKEGHELSFNELGRKLNNDELEDIVPHYDGIIAGTENYNRIIINKSKSLKVISRLGVGLDNIDLEYAKEKNIKIFKTQTTPAQSVVELTLGLMIDLARKISKQNENLKSGNWEKEMGFLLNGKTLGIIGLGIIGKSLVKLVQGLNFKLLAFDILHDSKFAKVNNVKYCELNDLLKYSDIISIHLNLNDKTNNIINKNRLQLLKKDSIIINTSRGEIIDEKALYYLLKNRKIAGAALDVFNNEPYSGPLNTLDNVILTPHIGAYAKELRIKMEMEAVENLLRGLNS